MMTQSTFNSGHCFPFSKKRYVDVFAGNQKGICEAGKQLAQFPQIVM